MSKKKKLVDTRVLCEYFGVTRQAVDLWRKLPGFPIVVDKEHGIKRYDLDAVVSFFNRRKKIRDRKPSGNPSFKPKK